MSRRCWRDCPHSVVSDGPRTEAVYGSWATVVCEACGATQTRGHVFGQWQTPREHSAECETEQRRSARRRDDAICICLHGEQL
jgi:hypothetical protein